MGMTQEGEDATATPLKPSSHLVAARRSVAASLRERWGGGGGGGESDAERDGVSEKGRARGGDTEREREGGGV